jgi:hypothetical protein
VKRATIALERAPSPDTIITEEADGSTGSSGARAGGETDVSMTDDSTAGALHPSPPSAAPPSPTPAPPLGPVVLPAPPPKLQPPTDPKSLERLQGAKVALQVWQVQPHIYPLSPNMLGLTVDECAQLVGAENWAKAPVLDPNAMLRRDIVGIIQVALNELEVSAAAMAAGRDAAKKALEAAGTESGAASVSELDGQPAAKAAKTGGASEEEL